MIWRGIAIGIIISAPMGPVGILCVQRTLEKGRRTGFFTGIGAAISDMFYCLLTGFGLSFIEDFLTRNHNIIQLVGSLVLIGFGIYLFKSNPTRNLRKPEEGISDRRNILNGFLFTFSNPLIIFLIIGLFARFNFLVPEIQAYHYVIGFISIGAGALLWWWIVTFLVAKLRSHFNLRSMWLINKIIGVIILIFALVGIISSITAMASATARNPMDNYDRSLYMNSSRGFNTFTHASDSSFYLESTSSDTISDRILIPETREFEFYFRASNLHNSPGKSYKIVSGKKIKHPGWGITITSSDGKREKIHFCTHDNPRDETYSPTFLAVHSDSWPEMIHLYKDIDLFTGQNAFSLSFSRGRFSLAGGNREYKPILSWESDIEKPDSIGFFVAPGSLLRIDDIVLKIHDSDTIFETSEFGNPDILSTHLLRSDDKLEGIWKIFDRSLDEDFLRLGGDYTFALINNGKGYDLIYLDGAGTLSSLWKPGMIKARLIETGFNGIFDVSWTDASGHKLLSEVKAQFESPILSFAFPHEDSSLRLKKINPRPFLQSLSTSGR